MRDFLCNVPALAASLGKTLPNRSTWCRWNQPFLVLLQCHLQGSFEAPQQRKRPRTAPPWVNLSLPAGSAPSPAAPCPGWPVSPLYLSDVAATPHWGQRVGSGLVGKIPTCSKCWSGGHQQPCMRAAFSQDALYMSRSVFAVLEGHVRAVPGCAPNLRDLRAPKAATDLTQQQLQLLSVR